MNQEKKYKLKSIVFHDRWSIPKEIEITIYEQTFLDSKLISSTEIKKTFIFRENEELKQVLAEAFKYINKKI